MGRYGAPFARTRMYGVARKECEFAQMRKPPNLATEWLNETS